MNRGGKLAKTAAWVIQHLEVGDTVTIGRGIVKWTVESIDAPNVTIIPPSGFSLEVEAHRIRTITRKVER